jgi:20S proteasome subunit alpha 4
VVESGSKNIEIAIIKKDKDMRLLEDKEIEALVKKIEEEKEEASKK